MEWNYVRRHKEFLGHDSREEMPVLSELEMQVHSMAEIFLCMEGVAEFRVEGTVYYPKKGDLVIMRAGEVHTIILKEKAAYERIAVCFSQDALERMNCAHLLLPFDDRIPGFGNLYSEEALPGDLIRLCFAQIFRHGNDSNPERTFSYFIPVLQAVFDVWCEKVPVPQMDGSASLPVRVLNYVNQHLFELETPQELTKVFYLSRSQLYRVFRDYTGTSLWEYVRTKRLTSARNMIRCGIKPQRAAAECGYDNYSSFYRAYKKQFGIGPHEDVGVAAQYEKSGGNEDDFAKG